MYKGNLYFTNEEGVVTVVLGAYSTYINETEEIAVFAKNGMAIDIQDASKEIRSVDIFIHTRGIKGILTSFGKVTVDLSDFLKVIKFSDTGEEYDVTVKGYKRGGVEVELCFFRIKLYSGMPVTCDNAPMYTEGRYNYLEETPFNLAPPDTIQLSEYETTYPISYYEIQTSAKIEGALPSGGRQVNLFRNLQEGFLTYKTGEYSENKLILVRKAERCLNYAFIRFKTPFGGYVATGWRILRFYDKAKKDIDLINICGQRYLRSVTTFVDVVLDNITNIDIAYYSMILRSEDISLKLPHIYEYVYNTSYSENFGKVKAISKEESRSPVKGLRGGKLKVTLEINTNNY